MKMRKFLIINILYLIFATSSFAQAKNKFEGLYLGIDISRETAKDYGYENNRTWLNKNNLSGNLYGYHLGYNFSLDNLIGLKNFIFSTQFEFQKGTNAKNDWAKQINPDDGTANSGCNYCTKSTFNESYSLLGKIGYLINEKNFINVAVGLTDLRVKREILYFLEPYPTGLDHSQVIDKINSVPIYGVGYERIIDDNFSFVIDARYLESNTLKSSSVYDGNNEYYKYKQKSLTAGINYRF